MKYTDYTSLSKLLQTLQLNTVVINEQTQL